MNRIPFAFRKQAAIHQTEKFTSIEPLSGYRLIRREDEGYITYMEPDPPAEIAGHALLDAFDRSRFIDPSEREFFHKDKVTAVYNRWQKDFMKRYKYKTKREAFNNMRYCLAVRCEGEILITPHKRDNPPWYIRDVPPEKKVIIPETTDPLIVGAAVKLALSHCE
jgi:hypothetical protein